MLLLEGAVNDADGRAWVDSTCHKKEIYWKHLFAPFPASRMGSILTPAA